MDENKIRAWWSHRQGLDGSLSGATPKEVLERSGWARSVAGAGPYLTLYSRAGTSRETADKAVKELQIHELPSARGCTYVVPSSDFALALKVGQQFTVADRRHHVRAQAPYEHGYAGKNSACASYESGLTTVESLNKGRHPSRDSNLLNVEFRIQDQ